MTPHQNDWPILTLPDAEATHLKNRYAEARVILEYGSGGSTVLGAHMPGKLLISVESDRDWALDLQEKIDRAALPSQAILYHADIGPTGAWGRPTDEKSWRLFHNYPTAIWAEPFFRHPDLILIDGRFRPACFVNACLRIRRPVTILFDDYLDRQKYHVVERLAQPVAMIGRMAEFRVTPQDWPDWAHNLFLDLLTEATFSSTEKVTYGPHTPPSAGWSESWRCRSSHLP